MTRAEAKLQRWIDLLAVLLSHKYGVSLEQLRTKVPGYAAGGATETVARMFERDKDELRALGVPIDTLEPSEEDGEHQRYRVEPREMYLPILVIAAAGSAARPAREDTRRLRAGYRSIPSLAFEPDELSALVEGARRVAALEDLTIAGDATAALRKLAFDLPIDSALSESGDTVLVRNEPATAARLRTLGQALLRLKRVTFTYRSMTRDVTSARTAEPYGLFFVSGHWYLAARDVDSSELRNFRVSRMTEIVVNPKRPQSQDYEIPDQFRLTEHAVDREAWELGDSDAQEMVVEFRGNSGAATAALKLGRPAALGDRHRTFSVRRSDTFCRWLLSFAGEAVPVSPQSLVDECRALARATLSAYGEPP